MRTEKVTQITENFLVCSLSSLPLYSCSATPIRTCPVIRESVGTHLKNPRFIFQKREKREHTSPKNPKEGEAKYLTNLALTLIYFILDGANDDPETPKDIFLSGETLDGFKVRYYMVEILSHLAGGFENFQETNNDKEYYDLVTNMPSEERKNFVYL